MTKNIQIELPNKFSCQSAIFSLILSLGVLLAAAPAARAQALPAAEASPISTGFALPTTAGTLQYGLSASESLVSGYFGPSGVSAYTNLTGDLAFISGSKLNPFSTIISGGRSWSTTSQPSYNFVNLALSQVISAGRWRAVVSDGVNYLPGTATSNLAGVPGVGDLGIGPVQVGNDNGQGVLTNYSTQVDNSTALSIQRTITGKTSANVSGTYSIMRFVGSSSNNGLDNDSIGGSGGISHQFDQRTTIGGTYSYSRFNYSANTFNVVAPNFYSQTASVQLSRLVTRKLSVSVSAGPQWTSLDATGGGMSAASSSISLYANVSAGYRARFVNSSFSYVRSTNSGYGVIGGSISDGIVFGASRTFARVWNGSLTASYTRTAGLPLAGAGNYTFNTTVAGAQVSRALVRSLSCYASYTAENQSSQGTAITVNAFNGLSQVVGFGLTFSPMAIHVGR